MRALEDLNKPHNPQALHDEPINMQLANDLAELQDRFDVLEKEHEALKNKHNALLNGYQYFGETSCQE